MPTLQVPTMRHGLCHSLGRGRRHHDAVVDHRSRPATGPQCPRYQCGRPVSVDAGHHVGRAHEETFPPTEQMGVRLASVGAREVLRVGAIERAASCRAKRAVRPSIGAGRVGRT